MNFEHHAILIKTFSVSKCSIPLIRPLIVRYDEYFESFGISDARELIRKAFQRPVDAQKQCFVVRTNFITHEAQNALLKVLEEPPVSTEFMFVVPIDFAVLPTLASRLQLVASQEETDGVLAEVFKVFLGSDFKERVATIEKATKTNDMVWQRAVKQGLILYLNCATFRGNNTLYELEYVARKLLTRGASNKMLLEQLALTLLKENS